jgi:hypothetical protein
MAVCARCGSSRVIEHETEVTNQQSSRREFKVTSRKCLDCSERAARGLPPVTRNAEPKPEVIDPG